MNLYIMLVILWHICKAVQEMKKYNDERERVEENFF